MKYTFIYVLPRSPPASFLSVPWDSCVYADLQIKALIHH